MLNISIRELTAKDEPTVWQMLMHAAHETTLEAVRSQACLARYATGWGRAGDLGHVALQAGQPIGAAWLRLWSEDDQGYAYIDPRIPELAIAVLPEVRGQGVGSRLLQQLLLAAQGLYPAVSLSVRDNNPAFSLYERLGFVPVQGSEVANRVGGRSLTMLRSF